MWGSILTLASVVFQFAWRRIQSNDLKQKIFFDLAKGVGKNISQNLQQDRESQDDELDRLKK